MTKQLCDYNIKQEHLTKKQLDKLLTGKKIKGKVTCSVCQRKKTAMLEITTIVYYDGEGVGSLDAIFDVDYEDDICPKVGK